MTDRSSMSWSELRSPEPEPPDDGADAAGERHERRSAWAATLIGLLIAGAVYRWRSHPWGILLAIAALVLLQVRLTWPAANRRIAGWLHAVGHGVGRVLTVVLLGLFELAVVLPVSLVLALVGHDLLADPGTRQWGGGRVRHLGGPPRRPVSPAAKDLARRPYLSERLHRRRRSWRRRSVRWAFVAVVAAGAAIWIVQSRPSLPQPTGPEPFDPATTAAAAGQPWEQDVRQEIDEVFSNVSFDPYLGFSPQDFDGTYVDVRARARASYEPAVGSDADPIEVWFFGGSAMFGVDQRNAHTIPSEFARLAEEDGLAVEVRNYGFPAYVHHQEVLLFEELLARGERPDAVVFYGGYNDTMVNGAGALLDTAVPGEPGASFAYEFGRVLARERGVPWSPPSQLGVGETTEVRDLASMVDNVASIYGRDMARAHRLAESHGIEVFSFWQPDLFSKALTPGEEEMLEPLGLDDELFAGWQRATGELRAALPPGVIDLSDALDEVEGPVMTDYVHTNEAGAAAAAAAIYDEVGLEDRTAGAG